MGKYLLALASMALLVGCGAGRPSGPSGTLSSAAASGITSSSGAGSQFINSSNVYNSSAQQITSIDTGSTRSIVNAVRGVLGEKPLSEDNDFLREFDCDGDQTGDATDADGDGFPVNQTTTFACDIGGQVTFSGSITVADADDSTEGTGFTVTINEYGFSSSEGEVKITGTSTYALAGATGTGTMELEFTGSGGGQSFRFGLYRDVTVTLNDADNPTAGGTMTVSGFLVVDDGTNDFVLQVSTDTENPLVFGAVRGDEERVSIFDSGVVNWVDGDGNTLKLTVSGGNGSWTWNDEAVTQSK